MIKNWLKHIGPGPLIAAAFIGPGTVTVCTLAGVNFGYSLLWAMLLSVVATIVLQEMSARLGVITQKSLAEVVQSELHHKLLRYLVLGLILAAIFIGNAAYEAGNISGGILGLEAIFGPFTAGVGIWDINVYSLFIGLAAFFLLNLGSYKLLERALIALVILMSVAFVITSIITKPEISGILIGLISPQISTENTLTIIALVGTTVVPYNLFLHSALAKEKWSSKTGLSHARRDTFVAVIIGGLVSMSIIITAASSNLQEVTSAADLAAGLEPLFGNFARYFLAIGLFAAGITSAITAPLAAAYVVSGCLGWSSNLKSKRFKMVWAFVLFLGVVFSTIGFSAIEIIKFAQVANGLLLPVIAGILLWIMNRSSILGSHTNSRFQNILGMVIFLITVLLGAKSILRVFELW